MKTKECKHKIEMVYSGGSDSNPLPVWKKCDAIVIKNDKGNLQNDLIKKSLEEFDKELYQTDLSSNCGCKSCMREIKKLKSFLASHLKQAYLAGQKSIQEKLYLLAEKNKNEALLKEYKKLNN